MANKRMFSVDVIETDAFYSLPAKAQMLYLHLGMRADDDGFVSSPNVVTRSCGASKKILEQLESAGYVIRFASGVLVVADWKINNFLRKDRHLNTVFQSELSQLEETPTGRYILKNNGQPADNQTSTNGIPDGNQRLTQYSIEENRVERSSKKSTTAAPAPQADAELAGIIQHYQAEIGEFPRSALDKLQSWREVFTAELICKAFDEAAENGVRNWKYIDGILKGWQKDGVKTLGDVERRREARKKPDKPKEKEWEVLR